ncbi:hypothetical protein N7519_005807 [Penicillium mononematosum]|uniref:uncharacterized protein n=1 Tax=Penicillium mononematosum TaxID=268346 RepID=UPI0025474F44|nr:uncharacterized protein N7519_005807 [Penicillium mononematosum]KAJ6184506.1 hypothetical protein N7519_005807 [Penicillium mononematosum]
MISSLGMRDHPSPSVLPSSTITQSASQHIPPMTLQNLPVEILCMIIRFIGSDQLRKQPLRLEDLKLSATQLVHTPHNLTLDVHGPEDWPAEQDIAKLDEILTPLVERNNHLASFTLHVRSQFDPARLLTPRQRYLSPWDPTRFLSVLGTSSLSHLVIDTLIHLDQKLNSAIHLCPQPALQIPSLKSVRLRMCRICPQILEFSPADSAMPSQIESVIINLSIPNVDQFFAGFSRHCTEPMLALELYNEMITTGTEIAKQIPRLKVVKIVCLRYPCSDTATTNCTTGIKTIIPGTWDWGDEVDPEPDPPFLPYFSATDGTQDEAQTKEQTYDAGSEIEGEGEDNTNDKGEESGTWTISPCTHCREYQCRTVAQIPICLQLQRRGGYDLKAVVRLS